MATMKYFNVSSIPTALSEEGTYYVKNETGKIATYLVSSGVVQILGGYPEQATGDNEYLPMSLKAESLAINQLLLNIDGMGHWRIRQTYASIALMNANKAAPIGTDGTPITIGETVSVVNSTTPTENGIYSYQGVTDGWKFQSSFNFQVAQIRSQNPNTSPSSKLFDDELVKLQSAKLDGKVSDNILDIESFDVGFPSSSGTINPSTASHIISPFIEYKDGVFSCFKENAGSGYFVAYYKADKTFIKRDSQPKNTVIVVDAAVTDCYFIKFSFNKNNENPMANYGSTLLPYRAYGKIYFDENTIIGKLSLDKIDIDPSLFATKEETKEFVKGDLINILNPLKFKSGFVSQSTGGIVPSSDWTYCAEYISINDGICPFIPKVNNIFIGYYDTSYANVGNKQILKNTSSQVKVTDFPNAVYVRLSWNNSETDISANYGDTYLGYYQYGIAVLPQSNIKITNITSINRSVQKEVAQRGNNVITVGSNNADYTSLRDAVNASVQDQIIFLQAGSYDVGDTRLRLEDRNISIIGEDKTKTIIWNDNYQYGKEPLNINSGYLKNLTIKTIHPEGYIYSDDTLECYAIHIDEGGVNQKLVIEDCDIISYHNAAVGIGLHTNQEIIFRRCNLYHMDKNMTMVARYKKAAMLCHPRQGSDASTAVNQYLRFIDCNMYSRSGYTITLSSTDLSEMNVEFIRCMTIDEENGHDETKMIYKYAPLKPLITQGNKLLPSSYGNNCNGLNFDSL